MLLTSAEISCIHLAYHASDSKRLHVGIGEGDEGGTVADDAKKVDVVVFLAYFVSSVKQQKSMSGVGSDLLTF